MPTAPKSRWFRITQKRLLLLSLAFSFGPFKALDIYRPNKYNIFILYCISLGPHPLGVQCLLTSSMGVFPGDLNWTVLGSRPCWCPSPFPFAFHIPVLFQALFFTCHWISFVFLLYLHSVHPSPTHLLGEFPGFGLAMVPDAVVPVAK